MLRNPIRQAWFTGWAEPKAGADLLSTRSAPEFRIRWRDRAAFVAQPRSKVERQAQWSVEIDDLGLLCDEQQRRRDPTRGADHATDHDP